MSYHKYDPPQRPHEMGQTSTGIALLAGLIMVVLLGVGLIGYALCRVMLWVQAL